MLVGVGAGYEFGVPLAIRHDPGGINAAVGFDGDGISRNHSGWIAGTAIFPHLFGANLGLSTRLGLFFASGEFASDEYRVFTPIDSATRTSYVTTHRLDVSSVTGDLRLELMARYRLSWLGISLGPWLGYRAAGTVVATDRLIDSGGAPPPFAGSGSILLGDTIATGRLRGGFLLSLSVPISLGNASLQWELFTRADAGALADNLGLRAFSAGAGVSLLLPSAPPPIPIPPPAETPPPPAREQRLAATVDLYAEEGDSVAVITMRDILNRREAPFLPILFFDHGAGNIPERYARIDRAAATTFTIDSLAGLDRAGIYRSMLNVLGWRLRQEPSARISLLGAIGADEAGTLASARAEEVRRYLVDVWGIDERRIEVGTERLDPSLAIPPDGGGTVRVATTAEKILAPVLVEWLARDLSAPPIGVDQEISAEAGVKGWTMTITQGSRLVGRYVSTDPHRMEELSLSFLLDQNEQDAALAPLVAELVVEDSTGRSTVARDRLPIVWERDTLAVGEELVGTGYEHLERLFLYPGAEGAAHGGEEIAREVAGLLRSGATVRALVPASEASEAAERRWGAATAAELIAAAQQRGATIDHFELAPAPVSPAKFPEDRIFARELRFVIDQAGAKKSKK